MSKDEKRKSPARGGRIALAAGIVVVLVVVALFVMPRLLYSLRGGEAADASGTPGAETSDGQTAEGTALPLGLEDGKLLLENVLQFDGINPDCNNESGSNIAAISLTNQSDTYLRQAEISVTTADGTVLHFVAADVPAGKSIMAFATDNTSLQAGAVVADVTCQAEFDPDASLNTGLVETTVDGTRITVKNMADTALENLVVYCHCTLGDQYFGGVTYSYMINTLAVGETAELDAADCILGLAEVVRITVNEP